MLNRYLRWSCLILCTWAAACSSSESDSGEAVDGNEFGNAPGITVPAVAPPSAMRGTTPATQGSTGAANGARNPSSPLSGSTVSIGEPTRAEYCAGSGAPISLHPGAGSAAGRCRSGLASEIFRFGLCACNDATFTGDFAIDALDSSGSLPTNAATASVGVNGNLLSTGVLDIHGSLITAGQGLVPITSGAYRIDGDFRSAGDLVATGANIHFGRDVWVDGDVLAVGVVDVAGNVHQTPGHTISGMNVGGQVLEETFTIAEPCACAPDQILDIAAIVAAGTANNHNQDVGLSDDTLIQIGTNNAFELECGRFAFDGGYLVGDIDIQVQGRTALFIDGDLAITGRFGVDVGTTGELDVFITGNLLLTGAGEVGSQARPAATRFYVGGSGDIAITGANHFSANLYAPRANVFVTGADDIYGSFFVGSYVATGAQVMHYDAAITRDDGGDECRDGCDSDLECGAPLVCTEGDCTQLIDGPI